MSDLVRPILLFADSQLLFWRQSGQSFLSDALRVAEWHAPRGAYLGACNGDAPEFYDLFVAAMESIGVRNCRHIPAQPGAEDLEFLRAAQIVLIGGGEPRRGWEAFKAHQIPKIVEERYAAGAGIIGISAGAILLGKRAWDAPGPTDRNLFGTFKLVPFVLSAHEDDEWAQLREAVRLSDPGTSGIGLPFGGGAAYFPDHTLQPIRQPLFELWKDPEREVLHHSMLAPGSGAEELPEPEILDAHP